MIVSWKWLNDYVALAMPHDELVHRLTMSGLNHEGTENLNGDRAIDLEVTSNRPDCLGHLGVAREIAVLYEQPLQRPAAELRPTGAPFDDSFSVTIECPDLCYRFTARLIRGVRVGPSPAWLVDRLQAIGVAPVNNVVDASNYVMFECGQPLHTFDYHHLRDERIIVREPRQDETLEAIDHRTYHLQPGMCVIADSDRAVGLGGVMGGADTEVSEQTVDVLVEAAQFNPLAIRNTARTLNLHSAASYRFERTIDPEQIDWASRRCCELILQVAGGELAEGAIDVGRPPRRPEPITLRVDQIERILGIEIPLGQVDSILENLGFEVTPSDERRRLVQPPSWRADVTREVDLIEEVGRIYGYDHVPDDVVVPMAASHRPERDRIMDAIRRVLTAAGLDEAVTASLIPETWSNSFSPWSERPPLFSSQPMLGVLEKASQNVGPVHCLRRSLLPSLLEASRINEYKSNAEIELFETANVYLDNGKELPDEPLKIGIVSERDYFDVKGIVESVARNLNSQTNIDVETCEIPLFDLDQSCLLKIQGKTLGWLGRISEAGKRTFGLRKTVVAAEIDCQPLFDMAVTVVKHRDLSPYPAISRDFNFIVDDAVRWADLQDTVVNAAGEVLESLEYRETFRDADRDGPGRKRLLLSIVLRSAHETLTGDQADEVCQSIVDACRLNHQAELVS